MIERRDRPARKIATKPYPGLRPFEPHEADIFCGRERLVEKLITRLEQENLLLVHGGSGCGKSSLVRAGIVPALEREHRRAGVRLVTSIIRPSEGPFTTLAAALAATLGMPETSPQPAVAGGGPLPTRPETVEGAPGKRSEIEIELAKDAWAAMLMSGADIVPAIERRVTDAGFQSFCLVVDQFEEIFSWARDRQRSDVELLVRFLGQVSRAEASHLFVLMTMRSDFLGACAQFPDLGEIINSNQFFLPNLGQDDMARAIVEPAEMFGGEIDPDLMRRLMLEASTDADPLPLLQHTLMRMVERKSARQKRGWTLTLDDLSAVKGGSNTLSEHVDEIWRGLVERFGAVGQEAMEWIFRALLDVEKSGEAIRRPRDFGELVAVALPQPYPPPSDKGSPRIKQIEEVVRAIVEEFSAEGHNLLVFATGTEGLDKRRVDLSHEALLRRWTKIAGTPQSSEEGLKQKEILDGLTWRSLAYQKSGGLLLSPRGITEARGFFARMRAAPERARRYLEKDQRCRDITQSGDWLNIRSLIRRSARWQLLIVAGILLIASLAGMLVYRQWVDRLKQEALLQTALDTQRELAQIQARSAEQNAELYSTLQDFAADSVASGDARTSSRTEIVTSGLQVQVLQQLADKVDVATGYMWAGDGKPVLLATLSGSPVNPASVKAGGVYRALYDIALRAGLPTPPNNSAPRIGIIRKNSLVWAAVPPERFPASGQYWVKVRPTAIVYLQVDTDSGVRAPGLVEKLKADGYIMQPVQVLPQAQGMADVRFCHVEDQAAAQNLADVVQGLVAGSQIQVISMVGRPTCANVRSNVVELWLGTVPSLPPTFPARPADERKPRVATARR